VTEANPVCFKRERKNVENKRRRTGEKVGNDAGILWEIKILQSTDSAFIAGGLIT
jgi:hypothetical protein